MTTQTNSRIKEIQAIWNQYQGLYVVGGILIGLLFFPFLELFISDLSQLLIGLVPEAIGIGFTVFFLDRIYQKRETEQLKRRLIGEAGSQSNDTAKSAVDWMRREGWLTGNKEELLKWSNLQNAKLGGVDLHGANLENANLRDSILEGANLSNANLKRANLHSAILEDSNLMETKLENANLRRAKLKNADLRGATLENADLSHANLKSTKLNHTSLKGANLFDTQLEGADLFRTNFEGAYLFDSILPDGTKWTPETDMSRFTDPEHPDFWEPEN